MTSTDRHIVGIDTQTMTWGLREIKTDNPGMEERAVWLFDYFDENNFEVVLPTTALAEVLANVPHVQHMDLVRTLKQRLVFKDFDVKVASLVAHHTKSSKDLKSDGEPNARKTFKADLAIVASCKVFGAEVFYSHDLRCRKLAERVGLEALDLPIRPIAGHAKEDPQPGLFGPED